MVIYFPLLSPILPLGPNEGKWPKEGEREKAKRPEEGARVIGCRMYYGMLIWSKTFSNCHGANGEFFATWRLTVASFRKCITLTK